MKQILKAFYMCLGMFTALPCPYRPWDEDAREQMLVCLPIVGAVLGLLWALLASLGTAWLVPSLAAALIAALPWLLTGFIHLDGFMDTSDAILSWKPLEKRQRILKDPHTGSFSVVALGLLMLFSYASASALTRSDLRTLLFIPVVSRCGSAFFVLTLNPIGHSEYAQVDAKPAQRLAIGVMWLFTIILGAILLKARVSALLAESLGYALAMFWAAHMLKGISGDVAGFALCVSECVALITLANLHLA